MAAIAPLNVGTRIGRYPRLNVQGCSHKISKVVVLREITAKLNFKLDISLAPWRIKRKAFGEILVFMAFFSVVHPLRSIENGNENDDDVPHYGPGVPKKDVVFKGPLFMAKVARKASLLATLGGDEEEVLEVSLEVPRLEATAFDVFVNLPNASESSSITLPEYVGSFRTDVDTRGGFRKTKARFGIGDKIKLLNLEKESSLLVAMVRPNRESTSSLIIKDIDIELE